MSFTPEELAEMARADAEIEAEFVLTAAEAKESAALDRAARIDRLDGDRRAAAERKRRYREANKEAETERHRRYYKANKDTIIAYQRRWREENRDKINAKERERYAQRKKEREAADMPKINLTESDRMRDRLVTLLRVEMARGDMTTQRVADKLGKCPTTVRTKMKDPGSLTVNELGQLVRMLHIRREDLADAFYGK